MSFENPHTPPSPFDDGFSIYDESNRNGISVFAVNIPTKENLLRFKIFFRSLENWKFENGFFFSAEGERGKRGLFLIFDLRLHIWEGVKNDPN